MANYISSKYNNIINYFIPEEDKLDESVFRKSRIRISIILITAALWLLYIFSALNFGFPIWQPIANLVAASISIIASFLNKYKYSKNIVVNLHMFGACIGIFTSTLTQGGLIAISAIILIPIVTMLVGGTKSSIFWLSISILYITFLYLFIINGNEIKPQFNLKFQNYILFTNSIGMVVCGFLCTLVFQNEKEIAYKDLKEEKRISESLLLNILPTEVAEELKNEGLSKAKHYNNVTILFTDFVNFTGISEKLSPSELVFELNKQFVLFDSIMEKYGLEKIKTIGDAYMAVCGLPVSNENHAINSVLAAKEIVEEMSKNDYIFKVRIGINSGDVVAGIVGVKKYAYDIWGDAVNTAARMEQNSVEGKINISQSTYELVKNKFNCTHRGKIPAKNKGEIDMYFVQ